ncbi:hypothetical protein C0992_006330 [Termitomyces sp. T32_za158]|nr:hypothetical protein C0992_006330 [Termitomyces sp. T32_za158]
MVAKLGKKEIVATAAVQKATHKHDIAATNLRSAQRDAELKRQEDTRLQRELDEKKARLDTALQDQKIHKVKLLIFIKVYRAHFVLVRSKNLAHMVLNQLVYRAKVPIPGQERTLALILPGTNVGQPAIRGESGSFGAREIPAQSNQIGQTGDDTVRMQRGTNTGYPREGPGDFGGPGNIAATETKQYTGEHAIPASATGFQSAASGTGYSGAGGENLGFRGDPMLGSSGTGADPGIRSGGAYDSGGRGGSREFIGGHNVGPGIGGESRYDAERTGQQQYIHHGTGIGGTQGVGEDPEFTRDRMTMGSSGRFGPGINQSGDVDNRARGSMISNPGFGENSMPGGYTQGAGSGGVGIAKERFQS